MTSSSEPKRGLAALPASSGERWGLILGEAPHPPTPSGGPEPVPLARALEGIYGPHEKVPDPRARVLGRLRWIEALEGVLPHEACRLAREDALGPSGLEALLDAPARLHPTHLAALEPTPNLIARLLGVADQLPEDTRAALRAQARILAQRLSTQLAPPLREAVTSGRGAAGRYRPGARLDLPRTLRHNLRHYDPGKRELGIERLSFHPVAHARSKERVIIALDSSGSMDDARLLGVLMASVLSRLPQLDPRLLLFDTRVIDVSAQMEDPVELLLENRLGGGTDLGAAVAHATRLVEAPTRTVLVLISDFEPGGSRDRFLEGLQGLSNRGVGLLCLRPQDGPAQTPRGSWIPEIEALGIPVHTCAPEELARPLAAVLARRRSAPPGARAQSVGR